VTADVVVRWKTSNVTLAAVRDDRGVHDVHFGPLTGWSCSCGQVGHCAHVLAAQQVTGQSPATVEVG